MHSLMRCDALLRRRPHSQLSQFLRVSNEEFLFVQVVAKLGGS